VLPQTASDFFYNGASMRDPVPGTIPIGGLKEDGAFFTGKGADGQFVAKIPEAVTPALVERGQQRYTIYCQPCHDARGDGHGILFQRGNVPTASFHQEKILKYPDGQIFDVITNGQGLMPGYRWPIQAADRWAIIAYVRELERKLLVNRGYVADVAVDGMDGWNAVRTGHYDLVITDIDMPRMDGVELATLIKKDPTLKSLPVLIVSYKDREEDRLRGLEAGADYYLTKGSFHDETLLQAVLDLIGEPEA